MLPRAWSLLIGSPLPSHELSAKRLNKIRALAAFSPDALSSIAYANQEIFLGLVAAGSAGLIWGFPIGLSIVILLTMVALSYFQTIHAYPSGGGSYVVARENLGVLPGLVAGAALMIDYVLTAPAPVAPLTAFLVLRAFASGSTALTGIEAMSNGVPAFQPPEAKNAGRTLVVMAVLMGCLFLGSLGLTQYFAVVSGAQETILSALARRLLGGGPAYYLVQISTLLVLVVAANTSFSGFPRLASILSKDGYLPRQLANLGDRLVYANGMALLAFVTGGLVIVSGGVSHALVPLFAVGAFLAFTLSQAGMVVHWFRLRTRGWEYKSILNGLGALGTGMTLIVVGFSKFIHGAWFTLLLIPFLVWVFQHIHTHFQEVAKELSLGGLPPSLRPAPMMRLVVPISGVHRATIAAVNYARSISSHVTAVYIEVEPGSGEQVRAAWEAWFPDIPLVIEPSPFRSVVSPLLDFLDRTDREHHDGQLAAVVVPEIIAAHSWQALLHNQGAWLIKNALLYRRRHLGYQRLIIDVPFHLRR